jgi:hypothetical protein
VGWRSRFLRRGILDRSLPFRAAWPRILCTTLGSGDAWIENACERCRNGCNLALVDEWPRLPVSQTDLASPSVTHEAVRTLVGSSAVYRIGFTSMRVLDMPDELRIGRVFIRNLLGPLRTQRTTILQEPGFAPTFVKWMEYPFVGTGRPLTVYSLDVTIPDDFQDARRLWRNEALSAAGFLAMMLDERIAQEQVMEDVTVFSHGEILNRIDVEALVRTFEPSNPWFEEYGEELGRFVEADDRPRLRSACRWYLRAASAGPTAEGYVLLWVALEALLPAQGGGRSRNEVRELEGALQRADPNLDPRTMINPTIGRLAGLRAQIMHQGLESGEMITRGFYTLESLTRLLLRHEFGVTHGWPYFPAESMLREPFRDTPRPPRTIWRDPPGPDR